MSKPLCAKANHSAFSTPRLRHTVQRLDLWTLMVLFIIIPCTVRSIYFHGQKITYFLRPLWQSPPKPFNNIPHYYHENMTMEALCKLHGWGIREFPRRVYDAVIFGNEIDMLTIRWNELYPYVTQFLLLESNSTFTGLPKPYYFANNRDKFKFIEPRLTYGTFRGGFRRGENPFIEEAYQRAALDKLLHEYSGIEDDDLLIMSDVDEIPSGHTIDLMRWCDGTPPIIHLHLRNYLYSFEFQLADVSWRASVHKYQRGTTNYGHSRRSNFLLADAGWHCSFCFRKISDFIFKMRAYSHSDRVRFSYYLDPERIQNLICNGDDLFDMLPEEHTFKDIIGRMGPIPHSYTAVHLPEYLLKNADTCRYLLPGNCIREGW